MTHKQFLLAVTGVSMPTPSEDTFASAYNEWVRVVNARMRRVGTSGIDAKEFGLWREVKKSFREWSKRIDEVYR